MSDENKLSTFAKDPRTSLGGVGVAIALATVALARGGSDSTSTPQAGERLATIDAGVGTARSTGKRLDIATDADVSPGASITAAGAVELGARLVDLTACIGLYDAITRICVLSPGPWELHSACSESPPSNATQCEIVVRNTGTVPLKFTGYVEVSAP